MKRQLTIIIFIVILISHIDAKHIIGGYMKYTHLEDETYGIELILIRDGLTDGANFDPSASFQIYVKDQQEIYQYFDSEYIELSETSIDYVGNDLQIEIGKYYFEYELPFLTNRDFIFVYQRCCLEENISNVVNPEENGLSIFCEITNEARSANNTSAVIDLPQYYSLVGIENSIELSAQDLNSDFVEMQFGPIYQGGGSDGLGGIGDPNTCTGLVPVGPCPPPYNTFEFSSGNYEDPFSNWASVNFDSESNIITGSPGELGVVIYGIELKEFRNGELINTMNVVLPNYMIHSISTSTEEILNSQTVYPNPFSNEFNVTSNGPISTIEIFNNIGENILFEQDINQNQVNIRINDRNGVYYLRVTGQGENGQRENSILKLIKL